MATVYDLFEVTGISENTTYSLALGNLLGVVNSASATDLDDGEFDIGDDFVIDGTTYTIDRIQEPSNSGRFTEGDGTTNSFNPQSESNLDAVFLTVSNGGDTRYFIIPSDRYGDMNVEEIRTGGLTDVGGDDAALVSTTDNNVRAVCFARGTRIFVSAGMDRPVEELRVGDWVRTADRGFQRVIWIGKTRIDAPTLRKNPKLGPIRIRRGSLGPGLPTRNLTVSPQHRVLVRSRIAERMTGSSEVLIAARHLVGLDGIKQAGIGKGVDYYHILLEQHEILWAERASCESLLLGRETLKTLGEDKVSEIRTSHPSALTTAGPEQAARPILSSKKARRLAWRHAKNQKWLIEPLAPAAPPKLAVPELPSVEATRRDLNRPSTRARAGSRAGHMPARRGIA
ncbi:Hint domain-containing protein [Palleronia pelagia]|uniref:Hint domain-containing protein n=1 Tax=Palleronia pelagia TaxID=387096 RepID=A0A1H8D8H2_9RHOB|nr:Hint domain-containing protein [Palleronia pelagia]SEN03455.1 Hint domain-containing protein [Palleronia pelagia]